MYILGRREKGRSQHFRNCYNELNIFVNINEIPYNWAVLYISAVEQGPPRTWNLEKNDKIEEV